MNAPAVQQGIAAMARSALSKPTMRGPVLVTVSPNRTVATVTLSLAGNGTDQRSEAALASLRTQIIPATIGQVPDVRAYVAGTTAQSKDFNDTMKAHLPFVFAFVLGLAFVLLLITFQSLVIPITTIGLNLLSVGAAYGILKLIFQDGYLRSFLGATNIGGVIDWLPLFLFVILFGLSMDYHVLILSRIREEHLRGHATTEAVARRDQGDCRRRHERGDRHGRRVLDLRNAQRGRVQAARRRARDRGADRRDDRPCRAAPVGDDDARRAQLVSAASLAGYAACGSSCFA